MAYGNFYFWLFYMLENANKSSNFSPSFAVSLFFFSPPSMHTGTAYKINPSKQKRFNNMLNFRCVDVKAFAQSQTCKNYTNLNVRENEYQQQLLSCILIRLAVCVLFVLVSFSLLRLFRVPHQVI